MPGTTAPKVPSYRLHKPSGLAVVRLSGRDYDLGAHGTAESRERYRALVAEWLTEHRGPPGPGVLHALQAVAPLKKHRCVARESAPIRPVAQEHVDAALVYVPGPVRAMIRLQELTGMRPGEVTIMRRRDLDTAGPAWTYEPQ